LHRRIGRGGLLRLFLCWQKERPGKAPWPLVLCGDSPSENLWHFCGTHDIKTYEILSNDMERKNLKVLILQGFARCRQKIENDNFEAHNPEVAGSSPAAATIKEPRIVDSGLFS